MHLNRPENRASLAEPFANRNKLKAVIFAGH
jgi:hypothetical protein